jgi:hypothetical protein
MRLPTEQPAKRYREERPTRRDLNSVFMVDTPDQNSFIR